MKLHIKKLNSGTVSTFDNGVQHADSGISVINTVSDEVKDLLNNSAVKEITVTIESK